MNHDDGTNEVSGSVNGTPAEAAAEQPHRRDVIRKGVIAAGVAGVAWSAPRIEGLSVRPDYAAAATGGGTDQGGDIPQPQDFVVDMDLQNFDTASQVFPLGNFGGVTLHGTPSDNSFDVPIDSDFSIHVQQAQATVTWDGLPGACSLAALDVDYTDSGGNTNNATSQNVDPASGVFQFVNKFVPVSDIANPHMGVHARFTCT